jgi:hypothetical protein
LSLSSLTTARSDGNPASSAALNLRSPTTTSHASNSNDSFPLSVTFRTMIGAI